MQQTTIEVTLPLALSAKWVAFGCRNAGFSKPKWDHVQCVWTSCVRRPDGQTEAVAITGQGQKVLRVATDAPESDASRRLVTSVLTAMRWAMRRAVVDASRESPATTAARYGVPA
jgi:hypothetical protein